MMRSLSPACSTVLPVGTKYFLWRFTITTNVLSGKPKSIRWQPRSNTLSVTVISVVTDFISSEKSTSKSSSSRNRAVRSSSFSHLAICDSEVPCTSNDTSVHKNTMLNMNRACGIPAANGMMAKMIGTAPRNPHHATYTLSRNGIARNGSRHKNTLAGRDTKIMTKLITPEQRDEYIKEAERLPAKLANLYTCDPRFSDDNRQSRWYLESDGYAPVSFVVTLDHENDSWLTRYERRELLPRRFQKLLDFGAAVKFENFESVVKYMAHCIHVEDTLWKKADEQWYKLNDAVKEDTATSAR